MVMFPFFFRVIVKPNNGHGILSVQNSNVISESYNYILFSGSTHVVSQIMQGKRKRIASVKKPNIFKFAGGD